MYTPAKERYETMEYNRCGESGLMLPKVSLGLWHNFGDTSDYENMKQLCFTAFDNGITQFDLANNYGPAYGSAERNFGKILKEELMPSTDGPAKGLRKTVCICKPLTESPAPATNAVSACGTRDFQIIFCHITDSFPVPQRIFHTARSGMETEPNTRFRKKNRKIEAIINSI